MDAFIAGAWRSPGRGEVLIGGQWRRITRVEAYKSSAWRSAAQFIGPLSATADPAFVFGHSSGRRPSQVVSGTTTATPSGGLAPFSYSWAFIGGDALTITNPSSATTAFRAVNAESVVRCTVTDALGSTATCDVNVTITFDVEP